MKKFILTISIILTLLTSSYADNKGNNEVVIKSLESMLKQEKNMKYQSFFDDIKPIIVQDELAQFLGVNEDGILEISYLDIVKVAGHSCATVAGAYIMASEGLKELYRDELPKKGEIKVSLKRKAIENNTGVVGFVLSSITGASTDYGFGGLPTGKFNRRDTLIYNSNIDYDVVFTRLDTNESVGVNYYPGKAVNPKQILMSAIGKNATQEDKKSFPIRFQEMVKDVFDNKDKVIEVVKIK